MEREFHIGIDYAQLGVFDASLDQPFNRWLPKHVAQGFAWRPRSVSFRTFETSENVSVTVRSSDVAEPAADSLRAIRVPFQLISDHLEIGSISQTQKLPFPAGFYALLFEGGRGPKGSWYRLSFTPQPTAEAAIVKRDPDLSPQLPLLMEAEPA